MGGSVQEEDGTLGCCVHIPLHVFEIDLERAISIEIRVRLVWESDINLVVDVKVVRPGDIWYVYLMAGILIVQEAKADM